ncbi:hypothetical protein FRC09_015011 [Ceratobasidium sp. 395]|nr:hypothetical protein FRC09_015011 [Ceratobasidium sp. 395]
MVHSRSRLDRSRLLSRILDPEYSGASSPVPPSSFRSDLLPQPSVFVDKWGHQHDPDFRPFGSYPAMTPAADEREHESWPWDDDDDRPPLPSSPRRSPTVGSHSSSSYQSSFSSGGGRSRSASVLATPLTPPASVSVEGDKGEGESRPRISPPGKIPRAALFPWTPAQRAVRLQRVSAKRSVPPPPLPPPVSEEEQEIPLTLVDSRYVPGVGHVNIPHRAHTTPPTSPMAESGTTTTTKKKGRFRSHTVPVPASVRSTLATEEAEPGQEHEEHEQPQSYVSPRMHVYSYWIFSNYAIVYVYARPSCTHSLRQSVYSFGLKTKLGLHHIKVRLRSASSAARRPLSL